MRFQIGDSVVTNKFLYITDLNSQLRPGDSGTVVEVDEETGGLVILFDNYPSGIGIFPSDVAPR